MFKFPLTINITLNPHYSMKCLAIHILSKIDHPHSTYYIFKNEENTFCVLTRLLKRLRRVTHGFLSEFQISSKTDAHSLTWGISIRELGFSFVLKHFK